MLNLTKHAGLMVMRHGSYSDAGRMTMTQDIQQLLHTGVHTKEGCPIVMCDCTGAWRTNELARAIENGRMSKHTDDAIADVVRHLHLAAAPCLHVRCVHPFCLE